ncbi:MAG TPA: YdeI/OmpD-associated family protein, partial [Candidatus Angelobacter sp.]|nr:YdeI/OmpD-associated family protein [Candidatus Angelobacter sp.]
ANLKELIDANPKTKEAWSKLSFTHQKEHIRAIEDAKREETREKRIAAMLEMLGRKASKK